MTIKKILQAVSIFLAVCVLGCSSEKMPDQETLTIMTHDSFSISESVLQAFEQHLGARVMILKSGDAGEALNKAMLSRNNPLADIFYGVDNTFLGRALTGDMFEPFAPASLDTVPASLRLDPGNHLVPVDYGDVCMNYDAGWFHERKIAPPDGLEDLVLPAYKDLLVVQNPATSSPGLAFLLATIGRFGENGYLAYWQALKKNGILITNGWKEAYWGNFTAASEGERPIVISYATSPAAEMYYAEKKPETAPTAAVTKNRSAFRQIEFAGILKGTPRMNLSKKAMDFLLSETFQSDIPLQMFMFPANRKAALPEVFEKYAGKADAPAEISSGQIDRGREKWIREWTEHLL